MRAPSAVRMCEIPLPADAPDLQPALKLLVEAGRCAAKVAKKPWEFGLELKALQAAGLTNNQVRWLLCQGYIEQAVETTPRRAKRRTFRSVANLTLHTDGCFILTAEGLHFIQLISAVAAELAPSPLPPVNGHSLPATPPPLPRLADDSRPPALTPRWLADHQELRVGNQIVKKFKCPAENQILILTAFEEEHWPYRIDNPLPPLPNLPATDRLHQAIRKLNQHQLAPLLRFHGDGRGEGVTWEIDQRATRERPEGGSCDERSGR